MKTISIVITSYNDKEIIVPFYRAIVETLSSQNTYDWELIYVDDGSTDGSVETLLALACEDPKVIFVELSRNYGQQKAFFAGMKQARGEIIVTLDGDFQYDPSCLLKLADKVALEGNDIVSGIRSPRRDPWSSRFASFIGQFFVRRTLRTPVKDFGAVKGFSRFVVDRILRCEGYCVTPYGTAYALTNRCAEVPVTHLPRPSGRSKWSFVKRIYVYFDLLLSHAPYDATALLKIGIGLSFLGFASLARLFYLYVTQGAFHTFASILSLALVISGMGVVFAAFSLSFLLRIYRQLLWKDQACVVRDIHRSPAQDHEIRSLRKI